MALPRLPRAIELLAWCSGGPIVVGLMAIPIVIGGIEPFGQPAALGVLASMVIAPAIYSTLVEQRTTYHRRRRHIGLIVLLLGWLANGVIGAVILLILGVVL